MRDSWYADKRDLVKWGTLAHIAERERLQLIVQIPYARIGPRPPLRTRDTDVEIQPAIWNFFRNLSAVEALGKTLGRQVAVLPDIFDPRQRQKYNQIVVNHLRSLQSPKVVLLDPDTGLAPGKHSAEHVTPADVQVIWNAVIVTEGIGSHFTSTLHEPKRGERTPVGVSRRSVEYRSVKNLPLPTSRGM